MTETKKRQIKKIAGIVGNTLIWVFVVFSMLVTVLALAAQGSPDGVPELFGKSLISIQSPSMTPIFCQGDLVLMTKLSEEDKATLQVGDIITYHAPMDINDDGNIGDLNTHAIYAFEEGGRIRTKGENELTPDGYTIGYHDIVGICREGERLPGVGYVVDFLGSPLGFFLCVVLPLILFFLYELYRFIALVVTERAKRAPVSQEAEEEIKRRAIEEYLQAQATAKLPKQEAAQKDEHEE